MESPTWTFARRGARLTLCRQRVADGVLLVATESGRSRTFPFTDLSRLIPFQNDMEAFLRRTGWTLVDAPKRSESPRRAAKGTDGLRLTIDPEIETPA